jgi:hypothetical protein
MKWVASANAFVFAGAQISLLPLFPLLAARMHVPLAQVLLCFGAGSFLLVWGSPFWAKKSDAWGRSRILAIGSIALLVSLALIAFLLLVAMPAWMAAASLVLSRLIYGLVAASLVPVSQALQSDCEGLAPQGAAMARHTLSLAGGRMVFLAAAVLSAVSPEVLLYGTVSAAATLVAINFAFQAPALAASFCAREYQRSSLGSRWPIFALAFCFTGSVELVNSSLGGFLQRVFSLSPEGAGKFVAQLLLAASFVVFATQLVARRYLRASWRGPLFLGLLALLTGAGFLAAATAHAHFWIGITALSMALGLVPASYLSALASSELTAGRRGRLAGYLSATQTLGYAAGGGLASLALFLSHQALPWVLVSIAGIAAGLGFYLAQTKEPQ